MSFLFLIISFATEFNFISCNKQCWISLFLMNCAHSKMFHSSCAVLLRLGSPKNYIFYTEITWLGVTALLGAWELYRLSRRGDMTCGWHYKSSLFAFLQPSQPYLDRKETISHHKHRKNFFFMSLASVWYPNHSGNTLSGETWSSKEDVINRKPECSTVKHSSDGLPGENKVVKGAWLKGIKTA